MPRAAFTTLGCKVNQYETQRILESFEKAGFKIVSFDDEADVYVVNTCSVTKVAESKSRYVVRRAMRSNPFAKIVVTGCAGQMAENTGERFPGAHLVVPNPEKMKTVNRVLGHFPEFSHGLMPSPARLSRQGAWQGRSRATLKIQDGCDVYCSYCSIPYTRPLRSSRPAGEILGEVGRLVDLGYREVVVSGVLVGDYGPETGSGGPHFEDLLELMADTPGLERIRISSLEMRHVSLRLMNLMSYGIIVPHLHIPLQSGDDGVLKDMNRPYTTGEFLNMLEILYEVVPDVSVTTDVMVGFPTETAQRFEKSLEVVAKSRFLRGHVFRFSPRPGTPAGAWGDPIPSEEKHRRSQILSELTQRTGEEHVQRFIGRTMRVLVEGKCQRTGLLSGLTDNYLEVKFAGPMGLIRKTCSVRVEASRDGVLFGEQVSGKFEGQTLGLSSVGA